MKYLLISAIYVYVVEACEHIDKKSLWRTATASLPPLLNYDKTFYAQSTFAKRWKISLIYVKYIIDGKDDELQIRGQTSSANSQKIGDPGGKKDIIAELLPTIDYSDDEIIFYLLTK